GGFINARMELTPADPATATTMDDMFGLFYNNLNTSNDNKVIRYIYNLKYQFVENQAVDFEQEFDNDNDTLGLINVINGFASGYINNLAVPTPQINIQSGVTLEVGDQEYIASYEDCLTVVTPSNIAEIANWTLTPGSSDFTTSFNIQLQPLSYMGIFHYIGVERHFAYYSAYPNSTLTTISSLETSSQSSNGLYHVTAQINADLNIGYWGHINNFVVCMFDTRDLNNCLHKEEYEHTYTIYTENDEEVYTEVREAIDFYFTGSEIADDLSNVHDLFIQYSVNKNDDHFEPHQLGMYPGPGAEFPEYHDGRLVISDLFQGTIISNALSGCPQTRVKCELDEILQIPFTPALSAQVFPATITKSLPSYLSSDDYNIGIEIVQNTEENAQYTYTITDNGGFQFFRYKLHVTSRVDSTDDNWVDIPSDNEETVVLIDYNSPSGSMVEQTESYTVNLIVENKTSQETVTDQTLVFNTEKSAGDYNPIDYDELIDSSTSGACYLNSNYAPYRTRLNTLFATDLVARANQSLESILSFDAQNIPEPQLGKGGYVNITFDSSQTDNDYELYLLGSETTSDSVSVISQGVVSNTPVRVFIPVTGREST
ncbi:hypothetical protein, partial [Zooshikella sp. RANM57]|uniref:hypothetical protein n=1 Tax=Zooshikella sp. RANM57 TaxID=3425863 RepID=UPI003D6FE56D